MLYRKVTVFNSLVNKVVTSTVLDYFHIIELNEICENIYLLYLQHIDILLLPTKLRSISRKKAISSQADREEWIVLSMFLKKLSKL
jgi:hypothetical protein